MHGHLNVKFKVSLSFEARFAEHGPVCRVPEREVFIVRKAYLRPGQAVTAAELWDIIKGNVLKISSLR